MKLQFLNKTIKHRKFQFMPRFYDERKELLQQKVTQYEAMENGELSPDQRKTILRRNLNETWSRSQHASKQKSSANIRVIILIILIVGLGYFIFNGVDDVDTVVNKLW
jgi:hypothetical protein